MQNLIVLDCETGGGEETQNPITQLALQIIEPVKFEVLHSYQNFVKPYNDLKIEQSAIDYTRVTVKEILQKGIDVNILLRDLIGVCKLANKTGKSFSKPIFVGHNIQFDIKFLTYLFNYKNKKLFDYFDDSPFDTLKMTKLYEAGSKQKTGEISRYSLTACCERFGIKSKAAHGAAGDVEATKQLFIKLSNIFRSSNQAVIEQSNESNVRDSKNAKLRSSFFFEI